MKVKIGITATNFSGNKGAAAMLQSIVKNIQNERRTTEFSLFSVYPKEDVRQNPYEYLDIVSSKPEQMIFIAFPLAIFYKILRFLSPIKKLLLKNKILKGFYDCDFVVDAAGISFVDSRGFVMNTYNFICMTIPLLVGKKVIKASQAMGPIKKPYNRLWAKLALTKLTNIHARGEYTYQYLKNIGLENVDMYSDIAFSMPDDEKSSIKVENLVKNDIFYNNKFVTLSISSVVYKYCLKSDIDYYDVMKKFIGYLNRKGYGVLIVANAAREGNKKLKNNDLPIGDHLYSLLDKDYNVRWNSEEYTPETIRELISRSEILVASRFHAMIGALEKNVPVLLVGWSHKYKEVLDQFELGQYAVDYKSLNYDDLVSIFEDVEINIDIIREKISQNINKVKESSYANFNNIFKQIDDFKKVKEKYIGKTDETYAGYSPDKDIRANCSSGGMVSQALIYLLEQDKIDGALVAKQYIEDGEIVSKSYIATTKDEIIDSGTSIYTDFYLDFKAIDAFDGKLAVVCLPCQLKIFDKLKEKYKDKVIYKLCLFCGGVAMDELLKRVLKKNSIDINEVERVYYKKGHWRGNTVIKMKNGVEKQISYKYNWCVYKNSLYYSANKCYSCSDFFGYTSDFSFGDIWLQEMKRNPVKHTAIIARNKDAAAIVEEMKESGNANIVTMPYEKVIKGNKRAIVYKYKTAEARKKIGKKYGLHASDVIIDKSKWNHYLASRLIVRNIVRSKDSKKMDKTFKINQKIMFIYMGLIRFLLSF